MNVLYQLRYVLNKTEWGDAGRMIILIVSVWLHIVFKNCVNAQFADFGNISNIDIYSS